MSSSWIRGSMAVAVSVLLGACGGGGGGGGGTGGGGTETPVEQAPPVSGQPTSTLTDSSAGATDLVSKAKDASAKVASVSGFTTLVATAQAAPAQAAAAPAQVRSASAKPQVAANAFSKDSTVACTFGGTVQRHSTYASEAGPSANDRFDLTFTDCSQTSATSMVKSGAVNTTLLRYVSDSDWAFTYAAKDVQYVDVAGLHGPYTFSGQFAIVGSTVSWSYAVGTVTVVGEPTVQKPTANSTVLTGLARANFGGGFIDITYTGWTFDPTSLRASAGSAVIQGGGGQSASVEVTNGGYDVTVRTGSKTTHYLVPF